ncbi:MAG: ABC transporter substrate-binding protein [Microcella sp.]|uniref:ABC transporter substrate-binding protein n=1 Tax=Microcella sp. TaxID=1913979 RepID=UPI0024C7D76D|nr:ABC transporter substrate-binding protein [Microcella sp.]UYN83810.1 MAG: ABC transporter substrate-binding protein [Microcella sp.]
MRKSFIGAALVGVLALAGCSAPAEPGEQPDDAITVDTPIGEPEKTTLTIALSAPNVDSQAPVRIAIDQGFYEEEGLTIEIIDADNAREGLVGGSLDLAVDGSVNLVDAAAAGTGITIVAGYRQREPFLIAARNSVQQPSDLEGKQIILGDAPGTPRVELRETLLAEAGFDLSGVNFQAVFPPGFSNAWVENFVQGQVEMTVLFPRHIPLIEEADGYLILEELKEWPNDSLAATESWVEQNPNTLARFIRATMKGIEIYKDLSQKDYVLELMEGLDFTVTDAMRTDLVYAYGPLLYDTDMGLNEASFREALEAEGAEAPEWSVYTNTVNLERAQRSAE